MLRWASRPFSLVAFSEVAQGRAMPFLGVDSEDLENILCMLAVRFSPVALGQSAQEACLGLGCLAPLPPFS